VISSASPPAKRWRQRWLCPSTEAVKYIRDPSRDQPADLHVPRGLLILGRSGRQGK
jgi:hypothetical protein